MRSLLPVEYSSILISAENSLCKYNLVQHPGNPGTEWIEQTTCFLTPEKGSEHISWCCWAAGTDISCMVLPVSLIGDCRLQGCKLEHWKNTQLTVNILLQFKHKPTNVISSNQLAALILLFFQCPLPRYTCTLGALGGWVNRCRGLHPELTCLAPERCGRQIGRNILSGSDA